MENNLPYLVSYKWTKSDNGIHQYSMTFKSYSDAWDFYTRRVSDLSEHLSLCGGELDIQLKRDEVVVKSVLISAQTIV